MAKFKPPAGPCMGPFWFTIVWTIDGALRDGILNVGDDDVIEGVITIGPSFPVKGATHFRFRNAFYWCPKCC